ncbi:MAG: winged helix-turn-helix transcriptional regulator [Hamadaea sp.]|nr:winged helix-turn-helix transcriptional regulator [Hamadaea sp.]
MRLTVSLQGDLLRIRVYDHSPRLPIQPVATATPAAAHTSGLGIVAQHATAWGARIFDGGKIVWATVRARTTVSVAQRRPPVAEVPEPDPAMIHVGGLKLDPTGGQVWLDGQPLQLTTREFELLSYLMARAGTIVGRSELLAEIWRQPPDAGGRTLDVYLCWLRRKLGEHGRAPRYLHRVRGLGIRLSAPPE